MPLFNVQRTDLVEAGEPRRVLVRADHRARALEIAVESSAWFLEDGSNTAIDAVHIKGDEQIVAAEYAGESDKPHAVFTDHDLHGRYATVEEASEAMGKVLGEVRAGTTSVGTVRLGLSEGRGSWGMGPEVDVRTFRVRIVRANGEVESSEHEGQFPALAAMHEEIDRNPGYDRRVPEKAVVLAEMYKVTPGKPDELWPGRFVRESARSAETADV